MNKTQHTPGQWKTEYQQYPDGTHICIADQDGNWIADFGPEGDKECEDRAVLVIKTAAERDRLKENNAQFLKERNHAYKYAQDLKALNAELLEALEELELETASRFDAIEDITDEETKAFDKARQAIQKAKGQ